ncbi:MAG: hypothetical protein F6K24_56905 [Okeania sp. SIO2D1]|nr:hypothetical protein [Okeania sp. SIO2D1]
MPYLKREDLTTSGKKWDDKIRKKSWKLLYVGGEIKFQSEEDLEDYMERLIKNLHK